MSRAHVPVGLAAAVALLLPAFAHAAGTADVDGSGVLYQGDAGANVVTFHDEAVGGGQTRLTISEPGIGETSPGGGDACVDSGDRVVCVISDTQRVLARLSAGNDAAIYEGTRLDHILDGEEGDDALTGSDATIRPAGGLLGGTLRGGAGLDVLRGRGGADVLAAGPGDADDVDGGLSNDRLVLDAADGGGHVLCGGPGFDLVDLQGYGAAVANLADASVSSPDGSRRHAIDSVEDLLGSDMADRLVGSGGANHLDGAAGNDEIDGGLGGDVIHGADGDDMLFARDGINDRVLGGVGADTCALDQLDDQDGCENPLVGVVPVFGSPPPLDDRGPVCAVTGVPRAPARRAVLRGLRARLFCDERGRVNAQLVARVRRLPLGVRRAARGDLVLAVAGGRLGPARRRTLRLRPTAALRAPVRRGARLRLVITATDRVGNRRTYVRRLRVR